MPLKQCDGPTTTQKPTFLLGTEQKWPPLNPCPYEFRRGAEWINRTLLGKVVLWVREPWLRKWDEPT